jgi:hypothetical protein
MNNSNIRLEMLNAVVGTHIMVRFVHPGEDLIFDISEYDKAFKASGNDIFAEINQYFATLNPERQAVIAKGFTEVHEVFQTVTDILQVKLRIQRILKDMYSAMPYTDVVDWVKYHCRPRMPPTMRDDFLPSDPPDRRRTYIYRDYVELVALAIMLRPMVPVWGEYILRSKKIAGTDYKELQALRLLYHTGITELQPAQRLLDYIIATTGYEDPVFASVVSGLGTEERPEWLLALNLIRRVAPGEINSNDPQSNIVTNAYNYTKSKLEQLAKKGNVKSKDPRRGGAEDDNVSFLEMYKVKERVSRGRLAPIAAYTENPLGVAQRLDETIPPGLLVECLEATKHLEGLPTYKHQIVLAQWILAKVIPPKGIESLNRVAVLRCIAVTQAMLWYWGFYDLAALASACPYPIDEDQILANLEGRAKIPKHLMDELVINYPHHVMAGSKVTKARLNAGKSPNEAVKSMENFIDLLKLHDWELFAPQMLQDRTSKIPHTRRLIVPADIRAQIALLYNTKISR